MEINDLRQTIDTLDQNILKLLAQRFEISARMGKWKKEKNIPLHQPEREAALLNAREQIGKTYDLSSAFVQELFHLLLKESLRIQQEVTKKSL